MKFLHLICFGIVISCSQSKHKPVETTNLKTDISHKERQKQEPTDPSIKSDQEQIQELIRKVLKWSQSKDCIELLPTISIPKTEKIVGFDQQQHKKNLLVLKNTGLFAKEFIQHYDSIIQTIDEKYRNNEYDEWHEGELPTFPFADGSDPFCDCQDVPYDHPNCWDYLIIRDLKIIDSTATACWDFGTPDNSGKAFYEKGTGHNFRAILEDGRWEISYMEGFNLPQGKRSK